MTTYDDSLVTLQPSSRQTARRNRTPDDAAATGRRRATSARPKSARRPAGRPSPDHRVPVRPAPAPGSSLHDDDLAAAPFAVSAYADRALTAASGLLDAWPIAGSASGQQPDPLGLDLQNWAAALRDALDLASTAVWVLSPDARSIRVTRLLDVTVRVLVDVGRVQRRAGLPSDASDERLHDVATIAHEHGLRVTGYVPVRAVLDAAAGPSNDAGALLKVRGLLGAAASGSPDALASLSGIPVHRPASNAGDASTSSPPLGVRVARAAVRSVLEYAESLYDAGRKAPR